MQDSCVNASFEAFFEPIEDTLFLAWYSSLSYQVLEFGNIVIYVVGLHLEACQLVLCVLNFISIDERSFEGGLQTLPELFIFLCDGVRSSLDLLAQCYGLVMDPVLNMCSSH